MTEKTVINIDEVQLVDRGNGKQFAVKWGRVLYTQFKVATGDFEGTSGCVFGGRQLSKNEQLPRAFVGCTRSRSLGRRAPASASERWPAAHSEAFLCVRPLG